MKKTFWLSILLSILFVHHTFAAYTLTVPTPTSNTVTATLSGAGNTYIYQLLIQNTPFTSSTLPPNPPSGTTDPTVQTPNSQGVVTWSLPENYSTTYYVEVLQVSAIDQKDIPSKIVAGPQTVTTPANPTPLQFDFLTSSLQGTNIKVQGQLATTQPNYTDYTDYLTYSTYANLSNPVGTLIPGTKDTTTTGLSYWLIPVTPNTTYYAQETYKGDGNVVVDPHIITFDGATGASLAPGSAGATSLLNTQSYTLLSGFPGLSVLPDPPLCAREQAAGNAPAFCNINDVLNYFLKLMIGLCGVVLVFRLMFEGYQYMMTDVPFLKASSKGAFFTALGGLVLALSAYLILNTINPKLVSESTGITQLSIGVAGDDGLGVPGTSSGTTTSSGTGNSSSGTTNRNGGPVTLKLSGGGTVSVTPCNESQMQTVTVFGHSVEVQKNLVPSLQRISAAWQQMNPRYPVNTLGGYNCRSIASITTLSYHAYGLAVDVNEDTNGVGTAGDMPQSFINLWTAEGWGWGGNWSSKKDPMHFSKGVNEQGNMTGQ